MHEWIESSLNIHSYAKKGEQSLSRTASQNFDRILRWQQAIDLIV